MKNQIKFLLFPILVLFFFIPFNKTLATSGACSYHGGVDCSAGAASDGSAICEDRTESSVAYSAMEECANGISSPPTFSSNDACSSSFPAQEYAVYTSSSANQQQEIKNTIQSDIQALNGYISTTNGTVGQDVQQISDAYAPTIALYQHRKTSALAGFQAEYAQANPNGYGSDETENNDSISSQYDTQIQNITQERDTAISGIQATANKGIAHYSSCIDSLNTLTAQLDSFVPTPTPIAQAIISTPTPIVPTPTPVKSIPSQVSAKFDITSTPYVAPVAQVVTTASQASGSPSQKRTLFTRLVNFFKKLF